MPEHHLRLGRGQICEPQKAGGRFQEAGMAKTDQVLPCAGGCVQKLRSLGGHGKIQHTYLEIFSWLWKICIQNRRQHNLRLGLASIFTTCRIPPRRLEKKLAENKCGTYRARISWDQHLDVAHIALIQLVWINDAGSENIDSYWPWGIWERWWRLCEDSFEVVRDQSCI